jgi:hypothetical protein
MSAELETLRVSVSSARGAVTVEVNGSGVPTAIRLGQGAAGWTPARTSAEIMSAFHAAHVALARRVGEIVASSPGAGSASGEAVLAGLRRRLGVTDAEVEGRG